MQNKISAKVYIEERNQLRQAGELTRAKEKYTVALQFNPQSVPALNQLGKIYEQEQDYHQAIPYLQQIIQYKPNNSKFQQRLAEALMEINDFPGAVKAYENAILLKPENSKSLCRGLAEALAKQGEASEAIAVYQNLLRSEAVEIPEDKFPLGEAIVQLSIRQSKLAEAAACFRQACEAQPLNPWNYCYLGRVLAKQGEEDEGINAYRKAIQIKPNLFQAYTDLGKILIQINKPEQAFEIGIEALRLKPKHRKSHLFIRDWVKKFSKQLSEQKLGKKRQAYLESFQGIDKAELPCTEIGDVLFELGELTEATTYNQTDLYQRLKKFKPEFVSQYWTEGKGQKPSFIIIGVAKCATTSLYNYMMQHPQIIPGVMKEPEKLSKRWRQIRQNPDYYLSLFPSLPLSGGFRTGEASTSYILSEQAARIVSDYFPETKLMAILRNPVKRYISQYQYNLKQGKGKESLQQTIDSDLKKAQEIEEPIELLNATETTRFLIQGLYVYFLERWMSLLPREQFLILRTEDLGENPGGVMKQVFNFLDLPDYQDIQYSYKNKGSYSAKIDEDLLSRLYDFYRPHNLWLEDFIGRKFNWEP